MAKKASKNKKNKPAEIVIPQLNHELKFKERKFKFSEKQQELLKMLMDEKTKLVFIAGPAGTSKTFMAVYAALNLIKDSEKEIVYVRTIIESGERSLGSLPGTINEKFQPFLQPLEDKIHEIIEPTDANRLKEDGLISAIPVNFLRGSTLSDKIVIADEVQNFTHKEITTLITRIGEGSKIFLCGDFMQSDMRGQNGFEDFFELFSDEESGQNGILTFKFTEDDIKRSQILKFIVKKIDKAINEQRGNKNSNTK
jgi:phosphate starvation-inducible PhoH-like protein